MKGFRAFRVYWGDGEPFLRPTRVGETIAPLEYPLVRAQCTKRHHKAPQRECSCGYHAFSDIGGITDFADAGESVVTEVWGYGVIQQHADGFRSERLQVAALMWPLCICGGAATSASVTFCSGWPKPVEFRCDVCHRPDAPRYGQQSLLTHDPVEHPSLDDVMMALAEKLQANVYGQEQSYEAQKAYGDWRERVESEHQERAARDARWWEFERRQREARKRARLSGGYRYGMPV